MDPPGIVAAEHVAGENMRPEDFRPPLENWRMELSRQEKEWALALKEAIDASPDLDTISDFWVAQIAMVDKGDVQQGLKRAYDLQEYRKEYDVRDTYEEARRSVLRFIQRMPGHIMHFGFSAPDDCFVLMIDFIAFDTSALDTVRGMQEVFAAAFYMHHTFNPDLEAVRNGVIMVLECEGYIWKAPRMIQMNLFKMGMQDIESIYPFDFRNLKFCHTGVFINMMVSMAKRYLPERIRSKILVGCHSEARLDTLCLVPTPEAATSKIIDNLTQALKTRYENEKSFRL